MKPLTTFLAISVFAQVILAQQIESVCPYLELNSNRGDNVCYENDMARPSLTIFAGVDCFDNAKIDSDDIRYACPFNLLDGSYAWVNETANHKSTDSKYACKLHLLILFSSV